MRRFYQVCALALACSGVVLAALLAWPPLQLEWLALLDVAALSFWAAGPYRWLAPMAAIGSACVGTFHGAALPGDSVDMLRLLGFSLSTFLVANLPLRFELTATQQQQRLAQESKRAALALRKQEEEYRRIVDLVPACICVTDAEGAIILRDGRAADDTMQTIRALFKREGVKKSRMRVEEMVSEAVRLVHEDTQRKNAPIECIFTPGLPTMQADRIQIQQILINLISNGIEAAEHIGRPPRLRISAQPYLEDRLLIEVLDNGPGVTDPADIFDAFVTTKPRGMGIGLAISRSIAQAHDGQLSVTNPEGGGACFKLVLPTE